MEKVAKKKKCPKCGYEFGSFNGETKLQKLISAGVDVKKFNFFDAPNPSGEPFLMQIVNGVPVAVSDEVFERILKEGTVENADLFRRFILAQIIKMGKNNFTQSIHNKGYEFMWKMLEDELERQVRYKKHNDMERLDECQYWYSPYIIKVCAEDYIRQLKEYIASRPVKTKKVKLQDGSRNRAEYKTIKGNHIFVDDIYRKIIYPIYNLCCMVRHANGVEELYTAVKRFNKNRIKLFNIKNFAPTLPQEWISAYKGYGSYFALQNLIKFHDCVVTGDYGKLERDSSWKYVQDKAKEYAYDREGWRLYGLLKKVLKDNKFDVEANQQKWREEKLARLRK
jgi:hypothetical protein